MRCLSHLRCRTSRADEGAIHVDVPIRIVWGPWASAPWPPLSASSTRIADREPVRPHSGDQQKVDAGMRRCTKTASVSARTIGMLIEVRSSEAPVRHCVRSLYPDRRSLRKCGPVLCEDLLHPCLIACLNSWLSKVPGGHLSHIRPPSSRRRRIWTCLPIFLTGISNHQTGTALFTLAK